MKAAPTTEEAKQMGRNGGPYSETERLAFEAWMSGHGWALGAEWVGDGYKSKQEHCGYCDYQAMITRMVWAAWRDRAALIKE